MSDQIKNLIGAIQSSNSQRKTYNSLLLIYTLIGNNKDDLKYFIDNDGLNYLIRFLSQPNQKILNISLGVLAECCIDPDCSNKVISEGILKQIINLMRCISQDKINYRCCKLIGNVARHFNFCSVIISSNITELFIFILNDSPSICTQFIIFRCLRYLWIGANFKEKKTIAGSGVFQIAVKYLESSDKNIQKSVLQLLLCLLRFRSDIGLKQLITNEVLMHFASKAYEFSSIILRIFYYLSEIKFFHFELAKVGVLDIIFSHIRKLNNKKFGITEETDMDLVLHCLHRLCNEPQCREKLCCIPDAFDILLNIIENSPFIKFKKYSVLILTAFMYDERSLRRLVKQRLILGVINYLQIIVDNQGILHETVDSKFEVPFLSSSPTSSGGFSPISDSEKSFDFSASPKSEQFASSPSSSIGSIYSPVCSPANDDIEEDDVEDEKLSVDGCSSVAESPLNFREDDCIKTLAEEKIFNLLKQLTFNKEPIYDLCIQRTWDTLLDYLVLVGRTPSHLTSLLSAIAGNYYFFNELLKSQFPLIVHKKLCRPIHLDCNHCQEMNRCGNEILTRFQEVAESSYGHDILRNEIIKTNMSTNKVLLALTIPHIVKNVFRLEEYLLRYKTLQIIMDSFNDEIDEDKNLFKEKVAYLYSLANDVYVKNPRTPYSLCKKCDVGSLTKEATISFLLDDGSTVTANKRIICEKSDFFEAMFRCGFKEAKESVVRLSNISSDCLTALFRLLHSYCDCIIPRNIVVLLELIVQSDRFLIPTLSKKLLNITMNSMLDYTNCHIIYDWAIENGSFLPSSKEWPIRHDVVKYALVEKLTFNERIYSLRMLLKSRYKSNVLSDINQIIEQQLKCKDIKTKLSLKYIKEIAAKRHKLT